jgi:predicted RecA/RadA family phage recombinase
VPRRCSIHPATGAAIDAGAKVHWVAAGSNCSPDSATGANKLIGAATEAAGSVDTKVRVH